MSWTLQNQVSFNEKKILFIQKNSKPIIIIIIIIIIIGTYFNSIIQNFSIFTTIRSN